MLQKKLQNTLQKMTNGENPKNVDVTKYATNRATKNDYRVECKKHDITKNATKND